MNCPKHVQFYSKNKFGKLVHLVGFIIRSGDFCLPTHNIHKKLTSMSPTGLKPTIPAGERQQTHALDRAATVLSWFALCRSLEMEFKWSHDVKLLCEKFDVLPFVALRHVSNCSSLTMQHLLPVHYRTRHCYALHSRKASVSSYWSNSIHAGHFRLPSRDSQGRAIHQFS